MIRSKGKIRLANGPVFWSLYLSFPCNQLEEVVGQAGDQADRGAYVMMETHGDCVSIVEMS